MGTVTEKTTYAVVANHEEQYSIWPIGLPVPIGWHESGKSGTKDECLNYIEEVWIDMRPLSLRRKLGLVADTPVAPKIVDSHNSPS